MPYRVVLAATFYGPSSEDAMDALTRAQLLAVFADGGDTATSMQEWCAQVASELSQSPELAGFEVWNVLDDDDDAPRFTLLYYPDSDSGLLFDAGTASPVGLALWPEGFKAKPPERVVTGIDIDALSHAFAARL